MEKRGGKIEIGRMTSPYGHNSRELQEIKKEYAYNMFF